jgi:lipoprotein-anchoring transpeptidase ErfK/SrfK
MTIPRNALAALALITSGLTAATACAQLEIPRTASLVGRDTTAIADSTGVTGAVASHMEEGPLTLRADLSSRILTVMQGDTKIKTYSVAVGSERYPTPAGDYSIKKIVWNPSWHPPPGAAWAKGKTAKGPGDPDNPMKVVKIFFHEPDYYIHGTDAVGSLGEAASHGCLRMDPDEVADLAKLIMEHGGEPHEENWFWRIIHSRREEKTVYLDNPISLTVAD